jgi:hypothetical protein
VSAFEFLRKPSITLRVTLNYEIATVGTLSSQGRGTAFEITPCEGHGSDQHSSLASCVARCRQASDALTADEDCATL